MASLPSLPPLPPTTAADRRLAGPSTSAGTCEQGQAWPADLSHGPWPGPGMRDSRVSQGLSHGPWRETASPARHVPTRWSPQHLDPDLVVLGEQPRLPFSVGPAARGFGTTRPSGQLSLCSALSGLECEGPIRRPEAARLRVPGSHRSPEASPELLSGAQGKRADGCRCLGCGTTSGTGRSTAGRKRKGAGRQTRSRRCPPRGHPGRNCCERPSRQVRILRSAAAMATPRTRSMTM